MDPRVPAAGHVDAPGFVRAPELGGVRDSTFGTTPRGTRLPCLREERVIVEGPLAFRGVPSRSLGIEILA